MMSWIKTGLLIVLTAAATYLVSEWAVLQKGGTHDLREMQATVDEAVSAERQQAAAVLAAVLEKFTQVERTVAEYRALMERRVQDDERLIAHLRQQIQVLNAQRTPAEQVAALRSAARPVRWAAAPGAQAVPVRLDLSARAKAAGFTKFEVRP